jgi:hypothetical protein
LLLPANFADMRVTISDEISANQQFFSFAYLLARCERNFEQKFANLTLRCELAYYAVSTSINMYLLGAVRDIRTQSCFAIWPPLHLLSVYQILFAPVQNSLRREDISGFP